MNNIHSDISYSFLDKRTIKELELFFANSNLSREEKNTVVKFITESYDKGHEDGAYKRV